jgi:hypothetical protein
MTAEWDVNRLEESGKDLIKYYSIIFLQILRKIYKRRTDIPYEIRIEKFLNTITERYTDTSLLGETASQIAVQILNSFL